MSVRLPILYDVEVLRGVPDKKHPRIDGIEYCDGWNDHAGMGLSIIAAYDYATARYRIFHDDNFGEFEDLVHGRNVIGFNSAAFDDSVCRHAGISVNTTYDVLAEIWVAAGLSREFKFPSHLGYGLEAVCKVNFDCGKIGNGALAPVWWQQGKTGRATDYCLDDVQLLKLLVDLLASGGKLINPKMPDFTLEVAPPPYFD